jgi:hypothetical protein
MDIQFVLLQDALQLLGTREVPDLVPRSVEVVGKDFHYAVEVFINDVKSPSFVVTSSRTLIAQVPLEYATAEIRSISVLSSNFTATFKSKVSFKFGDDPSGATGIKFLMQNFLKVLLTTPGTDSFSKTVGGNALKSVGNTFDKASASAIVSDFTIAVNRTAQQIRSVQARQGGLTEDERLLSASMLHVRFDPATSTLVARVELIPASGKRAIANLEL